MSKLTKKAVNGKIQFFYNSQRINASKYYQLKYELVLKEYRVEDIYKSIYKRGRELGL